jgi:hypothetical protein
VQMTLSVELEPGPEAFMMRLCTRTRDWFI